MTATYSMNPARKAHEATFKGPQDRQLNQCRGPGTRPAHHDKVGAPLGSGQALHPRVDLDPFVKDVWLL